MKLDPLLPGIRSLFAFRPEAAQPLRELAHVLHQGSSLSRAGREWIATHVSRRNDCFYCQTAHGAIAPYQLTGDDALLDPVKRDPEDAPTSDKLKSLLRIAGAVQKGGKNITEADIQAARAAGAPDLEIHDTVLIAATFCMYKRYVDRLATWAPPNPVDCNRRASQVAENGYMRILNGSRAVHA